MQRSGTRAAHTGADAGCPRSCRGVPTLPSAALSVGGNLAGGAAVAPGVGERIVVAADPREPGFGTGAASEPAAVAVGAGGGRDGDAGGGACRPAAERAAGPAATRPLNSPIHRS